ncbi:MAG: homoserine dehydrogenase [Nanoarchaeota archaeon]
MEIRIGVIGIGTIGSGVIKILKANNSLIEKRTGINLVIKKACDKNLEQGTKLGLSRAVLTTDYKDIINDDSIDIVVELIGGYEPARSIIESAIKNKKHIVTANKAVISKYGNEIFKLSEKHERDIRFEASVGGCIPIIRTLQESYISEEFRSIYGIVNGTTNYILTKMKEGLDYSSAVKNAQEMGFAEADPSFDLMGKDSAQKLHILSSLAFNSLLPESIYTEGITNISKNDILYADELGYVIKLLAIAKRVGNEIDIRVHPTMIPKTHELSSVSNEFNAIYLVGKDTKDTMLYGKGAGQMPTASVVVSDIVDIAKNIKQKKYIRPMNHFNKLKIKPITETESRYYFRFHVVDKPGVLGKITTELGKNNVSIAGVSQKEENRDIVPLIIISHNAIEKNVRNAMESIRKLDVVKDSAVMIRIEDLP